jgi:hypothetical protein
MGWNLFPTDDAMNAFISSLPAPKQKAPPASKKKAKKKASKKKAKKKVNAKSKR